jgi:hypothetical protein
MKVRSEVSLVRRISVSLATALVLSPALAACRSDFEHLPVHWDRPIVNGRTGTEEEAAAAMPFEVIAPHINGGPQRIVFTPPESTPPRAREVAILFADPKLGRFHIIESVSQTTQQEIEDLAPCAACEGSWKVVQLPRGIRGVLFDGPVTTGMIWLDGTTRFDLVGSSETFDPLAAILVASVTIRTPFSR